MLVDFSFFFWNQLFEPRAKDETKSHEFPKIYAYLLVTYERKIIEIWYNSACIVRWDYSKALDYHLFLGPIAISSQYTRSYNAIVNTDSDSPSERKWDFERSLHLLIYIR